MVTSICISSVQIFVGIWTETAGIGSEEGAEKRPTGIPDGRKVNEYRDSLHRIVHVRCRRSPVRGPGFFWKVWSFPSTAAVCNQGGFLLSAAWSTKLAALKIKAAVWNVFGHEVTAQQRLFSFLPLGRCNQHYVVGNICIVSLKEVSLLTLWWFQGKQALRSTSGSFAYCHFQLWNIDPDFGFAFWAIQWEVEHHRIFIYLCPCFVATNRAFYPLCIICFVVHVRFLHGGLLLYSMYSGRITQKNYFFYSTIPVKASNSWLHIPSLDNILFIRKLREYKAVTNLFQELLIIGEPSKNHIGIRNFLNDYRNETSFVFHKNQSSRII